MAYFPTIFLVIIFSILPFFQFLNQKFSKIIANLGILFIVMNSTHLNASKLVIKSQKAFNKFWFVDQFNSIFFMKSERVYTINTITIRYLDVGGVWCTIWRMKPWDLLQNSNRLSLLVHLNNGVHFCKAKHMRCFPKKITLNNWAIGNTNYTYSDNGSIL